MSQRPISALSEPNPTPSTRTQRIRRHPLGRITASISLAGALVLGSLGWVATSGAQSSEGFLASDYASSVTLSSGVHCWRGWGFELNEDFEVGALIGGGQTFTAGADFLGAIWEGTYDDSTDTLTIGDVVAQATFPEGLEQSVSLSSPVTLTAGQTYIIGMGLSLPSDIEDNMGQADDFDSSSIAGPSNLISKWISPGSDATINLGGGIADENCGVQPSALSGKSGNLGNNSTSPNPALGFASGSDPEPTTTTTTVPNAPTTTVPNTTPVPNQPVVSPRFTG
jgi:hypothetical protein